jgi:putative transposase
MQCIPKLSMRREAAEDLRAVFVSKDQHGAQKELRRLVAKYQTTAPSFADWAEKNVTEGQTIFQLPAEHRKRMRTTNLLERLNKGDETANSGRHTVPKRSVSPPSDHSRADRYSDNWETGRKYLTITP